jgi:hypothetical protein
MCDAPEVKPERPGLSNRGGLVGGKRHNPRPLRLPSPRPARGIGDDGPISRNGLHDGKRIDDMPVFARPGGVFPLREGTPHKIAGTEREGGQALSA